LESLDGLSKTRKLSLNVLMFKLFEDEFRKGNIRSNPFYNLDYGTHNSKASFDIRLNEPMENVAKKLYHTVLEFPIKHRLILMMSIMLARRMGELHALKCSHVKKYENGEYYVLATKDITKTKIEEKYPLPREIIELLPWNIFDDEYKNEPLFSFCSSGIYGKWKELIKNADIQLNEGHKLTTHDNRYLFLSILSSHGLDSDLVDRCLSHNNTKNIKQIYLDVNYEKRKEIFETWWNFLRS
jgi:integrase